MTLTVTVVDDSDVDRYLVKRVLKHLGTNANLIEFEAGDHFYEAIIDEQQRSAKFGDFPPPILILLDINMPRMNGHEVLELLQEKFGDDNHFMVVVMYSSSDFSEDKASVSKYSFVKDYIVKPITKDHLQLIIERYCLAS